MFEYPQYKPKEIKVYLAGVVHEEDIHWTSPEDIIGDSTMISYWPKSNLLTSIGYHGTRVYRFNKLDNFKQDLRIRSITYHLDSAHYYDYQHLKIYDPLIHIEGQYTELSPTEDAYRRVQWRISYVDTSIPLDKQKLNIRRDIGSWWRIQIQVPIPTPIIQQRTANVLQIITNVYNSGIPKAFVAKSGQDKILFLDSLGIARKSLGLDSIITIKAKQMNSGEWLITVKK